MAAPSYRHTQVGTLMIVIFGGLAVVAVSLSGENLPGFLPPAMLAAAGVCLALFGSLTVEIGAETLAVRFGAGLIRRRFPLREIAGARRVRNRWYYGWGIRLTPHGWLFNVSGLDAVEIALRSGKKYRIGTDDPEGLERAIRRAVGIP